MAKKAIRNKALDEPALALGVIITALMSAQEQLAGSDLQWRNIVPLVFAAVLRGLVSPSIPDSVKEKLGTLESAEEVETLESVEEI